MKRITCILGLVLVLVPALASPAHPWAWSTHVIVADRVGSDSGPGESTPDLLYGSLLPDMFNFNFDPAVLPYFEDIYFPLHYNFMEMWRVDKDDWRKETITGFVSHNTGFGADYTAHTKSLTYLRPGGSQDEGYVVAKAIELYLLKGGLPPGMTETPLPFDLELQLFHNIVEFGLEILSIRIDPAVGYKIINAAQSRNPATGDMLVEAYADDLANLFGDYATAEWVIRQTEQVYRNEMMNFGWVLTQGEAGATQMIAAFMTAQVRDYLAGLGFPVLYSDMELFYAVYDYLTSSLAIHGADAEQYKTELDATIEMVNERLRSRSQWNQYGN